MLRAIAALPVLLILAGCGPKKELPTSASIQGVWVCLDRPSRLMTRATYYAFDKDGRYEIAFLAEWGANDEGTPTFTSAGTRRKGVETSFVGIYELKEGHIALSSSEAWVRHDGRVSNDADPLSRAEAKAAKRDIQDLRIAGDNLYSGHKVFHRTTKIPGRE